MWWLPSRGDHITKSTAGYLVPLHHHSPHSTPLSQHARVILCRLTTPSGRLQTAWRPPRKQVVPFSDDLSRWHGGHPLYCSLACWRVRVFKRTVRCAPCAAPRRLPLFPNLVLLRPPQPSCMPLTPCLLLSCVCCSSKHAGSARAGLNCCHR